MNADIEYTIVSGQNQDHFNLNIGNGELRTAKQLDFETIPKYQFTIQAQDKGNPKLKDTAKVQYS